MFLSNFHFKAISVIFVELQQMICLIRQISIQSDIVLLPTPTSEGLFVSSD